MCENNTPKLPGCWGRKKLKNKGAENSNKLEDA